MKITNAKMMLQAAYDADDSVLMIGLHGIGKTQMAIQWAEENNVHMEVLYLSNQEVGDIVGIPKVSVRNGVEVTIWTEPNWLQNMREAAERGQRTALFLDEFSRAPLDIRQAALQLVLDRKIHQHELPVLDGQRTFIIAADNPDNGKYAVETLDIALLDRFLVFDVEVDPQGWLDYARDINLDPIVRSFIAENPKKLHFQPKEGSEDAIGATPRSWTQLAAYVTNRHNIPQEIHYNIIAGKIGTGLAAQFLNYMNKYQTMISSEDIITLVDGLVKKDIDIEKIGEAVFELTENTETIQKTELVQALMLKYKDAKKVQDAMPLMGMLYALEVEILTAFLKKTMEDNNDMYLKITDFDNALNGKKLFFKIVNNINFR